jgi:hypothetical protein
MRTYDDSYTGAKILCLAKPEETDLHKKYVRTPVLYFKTESSGDIFSGYQNKPGFFKVGEFWRVGGKYSVVIEEPVFYA